MMALLTVQHDCSTISLIIRRGHFKLIEEKNEPVSSCCCYKSHYRTHGRRQFFELLF